MPRTFRERPRLAALAIVAALLLTVIAGMSGAGLASGGGGMSAETAATLERARAGERHAVRELRDTRAALRLARRAVRAERRRSRALGRKVRGLDLNNRKLRRTLRRERRR